MATYPDFPCPQCGRPLPVDGEADCEGETLAVYQCDACTRDWCFGGETFPVALTFAVRAGVAVDPQSFEPFPPRLN